MPQAVQAKHQSQKALASTCTEEEQAKQAKHQPVDKDAKRAAKLAVVEAKFALKELY